MADATKKPAGPTTQERLKALVGQLQVLMISRAKFRPSDVGMAQEYDSDSAIMLNVAIEASAIAAVDKLATAVHIELAKQRRDSAAELSKQRAEADAKMAQITDAATASLIPFAKQAGA